MLHSIFAMELCLKMDPGLHSALAGILRNAGAFMNAQHKWAFYRDLRGALLQGLHLAEAGCWDFFDESGKAKTDYDMWCNGMITMEGARSVPAGGTDAYRGDPRFMTFTVAWYLQYGSASERGLSQSCNVPKPNLWRRDTFRHILNAMGHVSFASVHSDVAYLIPREPDWSLTGGDLQLPKFHYLRRIEG